MVYTSSPSKLRQPEPYKPATILSEVSNAILCDMQVIKRAAKDIAIESAHGGSGSQKVYADTQSEFIFVRVKV